MRIAAGIAVGVLRFGCIKIRAGFICGDNLQDLSLLIFDRTP